METNETVCRNISGLFIRHTWAETAALFAPMCLLIDRLVTPFWYLIGITGNPLSAKIWSCKRMRKNNSSAAYLIGLAMSDMMFLLFHFLLELNDAWDVRMQHFPFYCEVFNFMYLIPQYCSPLLVLAFTVERYMAVCHPFTKEKVCMMSRAIKAVLLIFGLTTLLGSTQAYIWTYDENSRRCNTRPEAAHGASQSFFAIWTWVTELLVFGAVPLTVLVLNIFVMREVRRVSLSHSESHGAFCRPSNDCTSTVTLLWVSFYLISTTLPSTIVYSLPNAYWVGDVCMTDKAVASDPVWNSFFNFMTLRKIVEEICLSHYACNFLIYSATSKRFLREVKRCLSCKKNQKEFSDYSARFALADSKKVIPQIKKCMVSSRNSSLSNSSTAVL